MYIQTYIHNIHFLLFNLVDTNNVPEPFAFYPLNGKCKTQEENEREKYSGVHLADGPTGSPKGSYKFTGAADSYIVFRQIHRQEQCSFTILCWIYPENTDGLIFHCKASQSWEVHMWMKSGKLVAKFTANSNDQSVLRLKTEHPLPLNQWHHVGLSYDYNTNTKNASLWLKGKGVYEGTIILDTLSPPEIIVRLGATEGDGHYFKGRITAMEIYDVFLTEKKILATGKAGQSNFKFTIERFTHPTSSFSQLIFPGKSKNAIGLPFYDGKVLSFLHVCG